MYLYAICLIIVAIPLYIYAKWQRKKALYRNIPGVDQFLVPPLALKLTKLFPFLTPYFDVLQEGIFDVDLYHKKYGPVVKFNYMFVSVVSIADIEFRKQVASRGAKG